MNAIHLSEGACEVCLSVCVKFRTVRSLRKQRDMDGLKIKLNYITQDMNFNSGL